MERFVGACAPKSRERGAAASTMPRLPRDAELETFPRASVPVVEYGKGTMRRAARNAICERELTLVANGERLVTLLCSDAALRELAYGFLYGEGIIESLSDVRSCSIDKSSMTASFDLTAPVCRPDCLTISSGFGGKMLNALAVELPRSCVDAEATCERAFAMADLTKAVGTMRSFSREYTITRGIHCSALFRRGAPLASFEDIGRHNTFDKLAGCCLLEKQDAGGTLLTTTGRISSEMVRKASRLGVSGIASLSGPTDKAIALAQGAGMLLAGYVTEASACVYAGM